MCILFFCNLINNLVMSNSELLNRIDNELTGFTNEFDKHFPDGELLITRLLIKLQKNKIHILIIFQKKYKS
ncbi:hypothetical protein ATW72_03380 [Oenococcus oeni]|nr:hypothetical protein ATW72_03380 [Oenococcus oeni]